MRRERLVLLSLITISKNTIAFYYAALNRSIKLESTDFHIVLSGRAIEWVLFTQRLMSNTSFGAGKSVSATVAKRQRKGKENYGAVSDTVSDGSLTFPAVSVAVR